MKAAYIIIIILIVAAVAAGIFMMKGQPPEQPPKDGGIEQPGDAAEAISAVDSLINDLDNLNSSANELDENADLLKVFQGQ